MYYKKRKGKNQTKQNTASLYDETERRFNRIYPLHINIRRTCTNAVLPYIQRQRTVFIVLSVDLAN